VARGRPSANVGGGLPAPSEKGTQSSHIVEAGQLCADEANAERPTLNAECGTRLFCIRRWTFGVRRSTFAEMRKALVALSLAFCAANIFAASPAEQQVVDAIKSPDLTVVHLWAPWCSNCQAELKSGGWKKMVNENPKVRFLFVAVWNSGDDGRAMLKKFEIADQPNVTIAADPGPRGEGKIKQFAGLPLSWIPTTWVYKGGDLRYALNYGEMRFPVLQQFLDDSNSEWSHKGETASN
jgi:thiol-disulfide isomerase/thioredoxin